MIRTIASVLAAGLRALAEPSMRCSHCGLRDGVLEVLGCRLAPRGWVRVPSGWVCDWCARRRGYRPW